MSSRNVPSSLQFTEEDLNAIEGLKRLGNHIAKDAEYPFVLEIHGYIRKLDIQWPKDTQILPTPQNVLVEMTTKNGFKITVEKIK